MPAGRRSGSARLNVIFNAIFIDATSFGTTVTVRILLIIYFLMRNQGKRGGSGSVEWDTFPFSLFTFPPSVVPSVITVSASESDAVPDIIQYFLL